MPGTIIFLANCTDPTDPLTTFGKGHVTDYDAEDEAWVNILRLEGKAAILNTVDVAATAAERQRHAAYMEPPHVWPGLKRSTTG